MRTIKLYGVADWIRYLGESQAELPEPFAVVDVRPGEGADLACEALRKLRRNPQLMSGDDETDTGRMWNINPALLTVLQTTMPGTVLDLGCGAGRDAVWLAANGWEVTAVDRLESNIEVLKKLRAAHAPEVPIEWVIANLNDFRPETRYDLVLLHYCWDQNYFELGKRCVAPGGYFSILAHTAKHYACFGSIRESKTMKPSDLDADGFDIVMETEGWSIDRHFVSIVLQRR